VRKALAKINEFFDWFEKRVVLVVMSGMVIILAVQVFTRYCLNFSFSWAEQLVRIGFVWVTYAGASMACKNSMHLTIDLVKYFAGPTLSKAISIWSSSFTVFFAGYMCWHIATLVFQQIEKGQTFSSMTWLPVWVMYSAGVIGMIGIAVRTLMFGLLPLFSQAKEGAER
jgi:TRAP-type C4-dicarboxylate transport system permease small subunit